MYRAWKGKLMTAYVIADIDVHDQEAYREYAALVPGTIEQHGGRFLVRVGAGEFQDHHPPRRWRCASALRRAASCWSKERDRS